MKNLIYSIIILLIYILSGCKVCKNIDYCPPPASAQTYFGAYTEGAYWIYYNQDSTKVDSVYITDFVMKREKNSSDDCIEWDTKTFLLHSEFLSLNTIEAEITNGGYCDRSHIALLIRKNYRLCIANNNEKILVDGCGTTHNIKLIESFQISDNVSYNNVIQYDNRHWFAPELGLIKFLSFDNFDTLYLHKYHMP